MKALAAFYHLYEDDVRVFFEKGWLDIAATTQWLTLSQHYIKPKTMKALIAYHREAHNWFEIDL